jgi:exosortase E/protease (VPEID-CTERM system)
VIIGGWHTRLGVAGFHSVAGWLYLNAVALGVVLASRRFNFFVRSDAPGSTTPAGADASFYLLPFAAVVGTALITRAFVGQFDALYPPKAFAGVATLAVFHSRLRAMPWEWHWDAVGIGLAVFAIWIVLEPAAPKSADLAIGEALGSLPLFAGIGWIAFRIVGSVLVVPLVEELCFRGYLIRKLVSAEFEKVDLGHFTWLSFLGSSLLFGALHGRWIAGTIAGVMFAAALYRRGRLTDAVLAHSVANALVTLRVLALHHWSGWT